MLIGRIELKVENGNVKILYSIFFFLFGCTNKKNSSDSTTSNNNLDSTKSFKITDEGFRDVEEIDTLRQILIKKFLVIANNSKSNTHHEIEEFFDDMNIEDGGQVQDNSPEILSKEKLSFQCLDYSFNYGWVGEGADSVFNSSELTALILIPASNEVHKGNVVNTICFKVRLDIYTESGIDAKTDYKREEKIVLLKKIDL
ncbi:MAG: hypothetical protein ACHQK8_03645 [Bacteroidia bacterium]